MFQDRRWRWFFSRSPRKMQRRSQRMARWNVARGNWFHHLTRLDGLWQLVCGKLAGLRRPSLIMACYNVHILEEWFCLCAPFRLLLAGFTFEYKTRTKQKTRTRKQQSWLLLKLAKQHVKQSRKSKQFKSRETTKQTKKQKTSRIRERKPRVFCFLFAFVHLFCFFLSPSLFVGFYLVCYWFKSNMMISRPSPVLVDIRFMFHALYRYMFGDAGVPLIL